ncbi:MAG: radical SAM protein [Desulfobacteraceae bacterium]|nr:MAG: radical SAM protein [Desulfobacteraceae bacterium]
MTDPILKLISRLFKNGIHFQYLKWTGKPGKPQAISIEITHHCIAKCIMCNIWKIPREVPILTMEDWIHLLSLDLLSDVRELDITGGEPFLRNDLPDLFIAICELKHKNLRALKSIAVTTNGLLTHRVLDFTEMIVQKLKNENIDLVMVCAMDAIGEIHEKIRNYKDAWAKVNETVKGLKRLRERFSNLIIGLKTTILPINVGQLESIAQYADSNGLFTIISPCIITEARYLNPDRVNNLAFGQQDTEKMILFYESDRFKWSYHGNKLVQYFRTGVMWKPCSCGFNYFFVRSTGELFLCPLINISLGNIKEVDVEDLFLSKNASRIRRKIGQFPECRGCTEPGLERYALPYEGFTYLSLLLKMGRGTFFQLHRHMGLDKYIGF